MTAHERLDLDAIDPTCIDSVTGDSLIAEHLRGFMKKEGRVYTAGKSNGDRAKCFQMCFKRFLLEKNAFMDHRRVSFVRV